MSSFLLISAEHSIQCVPTGAQEIFVDSLDRGLLHFALPCTGGLAGTFSSRFQFTNSPCSLYSAALYHVWSVPVFKYLASRHGKARHGAKLLRKQVEGVARASLHLLIVSSSAALDWHFNSRAFHADSHTCVRLVK